MGSGVGIDNNELRSLLLQKVDKIDLEKVIEIKSNKFDMEQAMKGIDVLHK